MKVSIAQLNYHIGDFEANQKKIIKAIQQAKQEKVDLILFAELAVCGYPAKDMLEFEDFITSCEESIKTIAKHCDTIAAIVGSPSKTALENGKKLYNSAFFLADKKIQSVHHKSLLPTYDIFDENRYFEAAKEQQIIEYQSKKIAISICEDIWNIEGDSKYTVEPLDFIQNQKIDFLVNIAASPFSYVQEEKRTKVLKWNAKKYNLPIFYVNHIGAQAELIFDGNSQIINKEGKQIAACTNFEEDVLSIQFNGDLTGAIIEKKSKANNSSIDLIHKALVLGIKDYFKKSNFKKAIIGLSGGIDSALTLALAAEALGSENVMSILMPSKYSSEHSIKDSVALCKNLNSPYEIISIESVVASFESSLREQFKGQKIDVTEENIQARARGVILMAMSNKFGSILLNTSNKSEMAVGYGTLYGDMCGGLAVIGDIYKTQVYELSKQINRDVEIIPNQILTKAPSAELRPDQKDSDSLPDYNVLDKILFQYIEESKNATAIIKMGFEKTIVEKTIRLVNYSEYKRYQSPPILRVSPRAFGMGRLMPLVGKYN